jgi:glycine betaine/choline ABC-type transport system substrate-binding protein
VRVKYCGKKLLLLVCLAMIAGTTAHPQEAIRIGSKKFTESVVVATLAAKLAASSGARVIHRAELVPRHSDYDSLATSG